MNHVSEVDPDTLINLDKEGFIAAVNSFAQGAENSGATRTGALAALDLGTAVQEHLSLAKAAAEQSGGFGKAAVDTADNGGIWAQYINNKDKVDNMGGVSYDGQYNGVIIGGDFARPWQIQQRHSFQLRQR